MKKYLQDDSVARIVLESSSIQDLLGSNRSFDLVILEIVVTEALMKFSHHYKMRSSIVHPLESNYIIDRITVNSVPYVYVPNQLLQANDEMTFLQRLANTWITITCILVYVYLHRHFPDAATLENLLQNVSLIPLNAHYSVVETPRPYIPNMIPIGSLYVQLQELPENLKDYLDNAKDGVALFSLGSNFKSAHLPQDKIKIILNTFAKFNYLFLWKSESDNMKVPANIVTKRWLPYR